MTGPTHYERLGVPADADPATIRAAYLRLARSLHPDRLGDRTVAERQAAERRLQDVNLAWSVLRDDARRREYDRRLRSPAAGSGPAASGGAPRSGATSGRVAGPDPDPPDPDEDLVDVGPGGCLGGAALGGLVVVLGLIAVVTAFARDDPDAGGPPPTIAPVEEAVAGDCVAADGAGLRIVPCDGGHDAEVVEVVTFPAPCPSSLVPLDVPGGAVRLCAEPFGG